MVAVKDNKKKIIDTFKQNKKDVGSAHVQIALLTDRINRLSPHFKGNPKDNHSRYGLIQMVNKRKSLLAYVKKNDPKQYQELIQKLGLRK